MIYNDFVILIKKGMLFMDEKTLENETLEVNQNEDIIEEESTDLLKSPNKAYIEASDKEEEMRSSFFSFIIVSVLLFIISVLVYMDIIPIAVNSLSTKILDLTVLIIMAFIFLFIAFYSMERAKSLAKDSTEEIKFTEEIISYCLENYKEPASEGLGDNEAYFEREKYLKELILGKYDDIDESYLDFLTETVYGELFPDNEE